MSREQTTVAGPPSGSGAPTWVPPPPTGSQVPAPAGRYQPVRFHARGGLGEIYVAWDQELQREVALKLMQGGLALDPEAQARFLLEAEVTGRLEHPGIVP